MPEMKTLCGYEVVDAKARQDIEALRHSVADGCDTYIFDLANYEWPDSVRDPAYLPDDIAEFADRAFAGESVQLCISCTQNESSVAFWQPAAWYKDPGRENSLCFTRCLTEIDLYAKDASFNSYRIFKNNPEDPWRLAKGAESFTTQLAYKG